MKTIRSFRTQAAGVVVLLAVAMGPPAIADTPIRQRAVDVFLLRDGTRLLGVSMTADRRENTRILLRGAWLQQQLPKLFRQLTKAGAESAQQQETTVTDRLTEYLASLRSETPENLERTGFLQERLTDLNSENAVYDVVLVELPSSMIRHQFLQNPATRRIGGLAVLNNIPDAETLNVDDVSSALQVRAAADELLTDVPDATTDSSETEFLRLLMAAERLCGKTCRLIHHAGQYISADAEAANLQALLPKLMQGQLQSQLQDLLGEPFGETGAAATRRAGSPAIGQPLDPKAVEMAAANDCRLVEVSQLELDPARGSAQVRIDVYFKAPDQAVWKKMTEFAANASAEDVSPEQIQRIKDDSRVRQVTELFGSLGTDAGSLTKAISMGAVVEMAQNRANGKMSAYLSNSRDGNGLRILRATLTQLPAADTAE